MNILKHGKTIIFSCDACGCVWSANRLEVERENDPKASVDSAVHVRFYMRCPDCGMNSMAERDRSLWDGDKMENKK